LKKKEGAAAQNRPKNGERWARNCHKARGPTNPGDQGLAIEEEVRARRGIRVHLQCRPWRTPGTTKKEWRPWKGSAHSGRAYGCMNVPIKTGSPARTWHERLDRPPVRVRTGSGGAVGLEIGRHQAVKVVSGAGGARAAWQGPEIVRQFSSELVPPTYLSLAFENSAFGKNRSPKPDAIGNPVA